MDYISLFLWIFLGSTVAGFFGALSGLGGGVIIVPMLVLGLGVDIHYAIGASLVAVIATSSVASTAFIREGYTNLRIALFLATASTVGAIIGASVGVYAPREVLMVIFGLVLIYSGIASYLPHPAVKETEPSPSAAFLKLGGSYITEEGVETYQAQDIVGGYTTMVLAGILSGLLGIGSGAVKVLALDRIMRLPFRVSTATSNVMIGMTALASGGVYLNKGYIDPALVMPLVLGITCGAFSASRLFPKIKICTLRLVFTMLIFVIAGQMLWSGFNGGG